MIEIDLVTKLGPHLPLSTRRVVSWAREPAKYQTKVGLIEGVADGAVLFRSPDASGKLIEITPAEARKIADAFHHAAFAVEEWQKIASGYHRVLATRAPDGTVSVTFHHRTRPMRLSTLRGHKQYNGTVVFYRRCDACRTDGHKQIWVAADDLRERGGYRVEHAEVCPACIDKLTSEPEKRADVITLPTPPTGDETA
jgi:hypothetical protein